MLNDRFYLAPNAISPICSDAIVPQALLQRRSHSEFPPPLTLAAYPQRFSATIRVGLKAAARHGGRARRR